MEKLFFQKYYHPRAQIHIRLIYGGCLLCIKNKPKVNRKYDVGKSRYYEATKPQMSIYINIIPSLMKSKHGYTCFLLIVDGFSKLASAVAMKSKHEAEVTKAVLSFFFSAGHTLLQIQRPAL